MRSSFLFNCGELEYNHIGQTLLYRGMKEWGNVKVISVLWLEIML